jgi:hypothetical protein
VAEARQQLVDAMRAWAVWAGLRHPDGGGDAASDWLMFSGDFVAGHVHRPAGGPRHDPHWILLGTSATEYPDPRAGWANSIDEAKEDLQRAWQAWLEWAELGASS